MKDVIRRRGENISSFEVETEVMSHPLVKDAAAIAVKNPDVDEASGDEEVMVVVVLEDGATLDPVELVDYLAERMPRHWVPRFVEYAEPAAHRVAQAEEGRAPRGGRHSHDVGPREGGDRLQARSPDVSAASPLELVDGAARARRGGRAARAAR